MSSTFHRRERSGGLRRYVAANVPEETRRSQVKVLRPWPAEPGAEAQIDCGRLGRWPDPAARRPVTVWAFVMVLACSRHLFVRPVIRLDQEAWSQCHVAAFEFFGGVPARLVPDNLKTGVDRPDLYDPKINRSYAELAAHYGFLPDPARAFRPTDKPRVERPMPYVRHSFWRGRQFASLAQMQAEAERWCTEVAGSAGRWTARPRPRCSPRRRRTRSSRCRPTRSCWRYGQRRRSARTSTRGWARFCTRRRGGTSARPPTSG
jgi:transposase